MKVMNKRKIKWIAVLALFITLVSLLGYKTYLRYQEKIVQDKISFVNHEIDELLMIFTPYPPTFKDKKAKETSIKRLRDTIALSKTLLEKTKGKQKAKVEWQLGEMYRFEYNLDTPGSWQKSKQYLLQAIQNDPQFVKAYLSLGFLYVNANVTLAPDAEKLFLKAKNIATGDDLKAAYNGLYFSYYYQLRPDKAYKIVIDALRLFPQDKGFQNLRELIEKVINR